jgi:hypothetical protein
LPKDFDFPTGSEVATWSGGRLNLRTRRQYEGAEDALDELASEGALVSFGRNKVYVLVIVVIIVFALMFVRHGGFYVSCMRDRRKCPGSLFEVAKLLQGSSQTWGGPFAASVHPPR